MIGDVGQSDTEAADSVIPEDFDQHRTIPNMEIKLVFPPVSWNGEGVREYLGWKGVGSIQHLERRPESEFVPTLIGSMGWSVGLEESHHIQQGTGRCWRPTE
jgi:hypothetical protein